jgi:superfamily I DNA and RNA helicase
MKVLWAAIIIVLAGLGFWYSQPSEQVTDTDVTQVVPVISRQDILEASDLVAGVKQAVRQQDDAAVKQWLEKAIALAKEAGLPKEDISYLQSDMAVNYLEFHAKRSLFNDAVEQAYYDLYDIEPLKIQYPEAQDLFAKADQLVADRDKLIQQIAAELAQGEDTDEQTLQAARQLWKQRFNANN